MTTEFLTLFSFFTLRVGIPLLITLGIGFALSQLDERRGALSG